ncbi:hypothetical protein N483_10875 [Pseudoalteromonas luteoviolacea NCIMB 1944]|nr:hypothetical protein N483_10875 [Pseudoalteromonas luteoviolacea NCIMB 1944]
MPLMSKKVAVESYQYKLILNIFMPDLLWVNQ